MNDNEEIIDKHTDAISIIIDCSFQKMNEVPFIPELSKGIAIA